MSNFKETKMAIDEVFSANWSTTPIQYAGMDFDSTGIEKWINVVYEPQTNSVTGVSGSSSVSIGSIYIVCWTGYQFDTLELADSVVALIDTYLPQTISNISHSTIDQGFNQNGKAYVVLNFQIKSFITVC